MHVMFAGDFYDPSIERRIEFGPAKDSLEGVKTVESSEGEVTPNNSLN